MSKCNNCDVIIMDKTDVCPLCHQVLSGDKSGTYNMYPDVKDTSRKYRMAENLILFLSVVITLVSLTVDYMIDGEMGWKTVPNHRAKHPRQSVKSVFEKKTRRR